MHICAFCQQQPRYEGMAAGGCSVQRGAVVLVVKRRGGTKEEEGVREREG